jgi:C-terminal processing protease CtpA/Prc
MATAATSVQRLAQLQVQSHVEVYSGIGVAIRERPDGQVQVFEVNPAGPADGELFPGALLVAADGDTPRDIEGWKHALRGDPGTQVDVTVSYPGACTHSVTIERQVVRAWRP